LAMILCRADLIICVTEDARENFREFLPSFPVAKLTVVPNGIDATPFAVAAERRRLSAPGGREPGSPFTFAFLGRFMPQKGFDILIAAVAELVAHGNNGQAFRVLAMNRGDRIGNYRQEVRRRGLEGVVIFAGFRDGIADILVEADAVVMPSRWEAAGLVAMEALAAGCPLIASDCVGLREVIRYTPALVAKTEDSQSLAAQMRAAMESHAELRRAFSEFAPEAQDRFDVRHSATTMERIFSTFAGSPLETDGGRRTEKAEATRL
jgi:glycosyltransferase involved in cell wall biosynthesis